MPATPATTVNIMPETVVPGHPAAENFFQELPFSEHDDSHINEDVTVAAAQTQPMMMSLLRYASQDVLLLISRQFLDDVDAFALGRCCTVTLHSMRRYEMRTRIKFVDLLKSRWECADLIRAMNEEQKTMIEQSWYKKSKRQKKWNATDGETAAITSTSISTVKLIPHNAKHQIGRYTNISYFENPLTVKHQFMIELLHHLPASIKCIDFSLVERPIILPTFPPQLTTLKMGYRAPQLPLSSIIFPSSLLELEIFFRGPELREVQSLRLPQQLRRLDMNIKFDDAELVLPSTLTELRLEFCDHERSIENLRLPEGLTSLIFCDYNMSIDNLHLPLTLTSLEFDVTFNQPLREWNPPPSLTEFTLPWWDLPGDQLRLPSSLTAFTFSEYYNHSLVDMNFGSPLSSLTYLELSRRYNTSLRGVQLPNSLLELQLGWSFSQSLSKDDWMPPPNLVVLKIRNLYMSFAQLYLPPTIKNLTIGYSRRLSSHLENVLLNCPNQDIAEFNELTCPWPSSLHTLILNSEFFRVHSLHIPPSLPVNLKFLRLHPKCHKSWRQFVTIPSECQMVDETESEWDENETKDMNLNDE